MKEKLTIERQIDKLKQNGVEFNIVKEADAAKFLSNNTYFFKIKAFDKNYNKHVEGSKTGKYINLEFAYLKELSIIDMHFRKVILNLAINIEHALKVNLNKELCKNIHENGYDIVNEFLYKYDYIQENIEKKTAYYNKDLINKYNNNFAVWNIIEILSFGDFIKLYNLYFEKYREDNQYLSFLWNINHLRNAAAHNNCLINNLKKDYCFTPSKKILTIVSKIPTVSKVEKDKKLSKPFLHDFVALMFVFNEVIKSKDIKMHLYEELNIFKIRLFKNIKFFHDNRNILTSLQFIEKIIDFFENSAYNNYEDQKAKSF